MLNLLWNIVDWFFFVLTMMSTCYLFLFAFLSLFPMSARRMGMEPLRRFLVLVPAYKEDAVILPSVRSVLNQTYYKELLDIVVISDRMTPETNAEVERLGATVINAQFESSSKAKALNLAMSQFEKGEFDFVVILDADNLIEKNFIELLNYAFEESVSVIQTHRQAKNIDTDMAYLDAISEEINNSIFRKGHSIAGLSAALIGSGMAFRFDWLKDNISKVASVGEDKELELLLAQQKIAVSYQDHLVVLDEKTKHEKMFYKQRRRWLAAQLHSLRLLVHSSFNKTNWSLDFLDKMFQWIMLPRVVILGIALLASFISFFVEEAILTKWVLVTFLLIVALFLATPRRYFTKRLLRVVLRLPLIFILMVANMFRLRGVLKSFIHTDKN